MLLAPLGRWLVVLAQVHLALCFQCYLGRDAEFQAAECLSCQVGPGPVSLELQTIHRFLQSRKFFTVKIQF